MKDDWRRELEEEYAMTDDDRALLEHVLGDDRPPQGLHRQGYDRPRHCGRAMERDHTRKFWTCAECGAEKSEAELRGASDSSEWRDWEFAALDDYLRPFDDDYF